MKKVILHPNKKDIKATSILNGLHFGKKSKITYKVTCLGSV